MKKRALIITASIRSHLIPAMFFADLLKERYKCLFTVTNETLKDLVEENNYSSKPVSDLMVLTKGMDEFYIRSIKKEKVNFWNYISVLFKNEHYKFKKNELSNIINEVSPSIIIIDIFRSTDYLVIKSINPNIKIIFFNPMLSTYRVKNYPIVSEGTWPNTNQKVRQVPDNGPNNIKQKIINLLWKRSRAQILKEANIKEDQIDNSNKFTKMILGVPEFIAAPLHLEVAAEVRRENQNYLGLCIRENRVDPEIDPDFSKKWPDILGSNRGIIYCSFGTFYNGADRPLLNFLLKLINVVKDVPNYQLVISVNRWVIQALNIQFCNVHLFTKVPQLQVLQNSDLFITHGGLGSIKESIEYCVPMLVYPLDLKYDQNGNALKIEYHRLGLRGNFLYERYVDLNSKILQILGDKSFEENIKNFKMKIQSVYTSNYFDRLINEL